MFERANKAVENFFSLPSGSRCAPLGPSKSLDFLINLCSWSPEMNRSPSPGMMIVLAPEVPGQPASHTSPPNLLCCAACQAHQPVCQQASQLAYSVPATQSRTLPSYRKQAPAFSSLKTDRFLGVGDEGLFANSINFRSTRHPQ